MKRGESVGREGAAVWLLVPLLLIAVALLGVWVASGRTGFPTPEISPNGLPAEVTHARSASFIFTASRSVTFECALDGQPLAGCGVGVIAAKTYPGPLPFGQHTFRVRAAAGHRTSPAATYSWLILRSARPSSGQPSGNQPSGNRSGGGSSQSSSQGSGGQGSNGGTSDGGTSDGSSGGRSSPGAPAPPPPPPPPPPASGMPFALSGSVSGLVPGSARVIPVTITNPNSVSIRVTRVTVSVSADSSPPGCSSEANLVLYQPTGITKGAPVTVSADGKVTLRAYPRAPKIGVRQVRPSQDACKHASFRLMYTGSAHP